LRKVALFTHFRGGKRLPAPRSGDIQLVFGEHCWFWYIPLQNDRVSVGCVLDADRYQAARAAPEVFLQERIHSSPLVRELLGRAERARPVHVAVDFSYGSSRYVGDGFLLAGDAAAFLDPIFSTGVLLAMKSGELAANLLARRLFRDAPLRAAHFRTYDRKLRRWTRAYFQLIRAYYHPGFPAVFMNPPPGVRRLMTPFFAGKVEVGPLQRLLLWVFYRAIELNHRHPRLRDPRPEASRVHHG
jgi:flavin-dependent dehydrogenase